MEKSKSKVEVAKEVLIDLEREVADITGTAIFRANGIVITCAMPKEIDERLVAGMGASILGASKKAADTLLEAEIKNLHLTTAKGDLFIVDAGEVFLVLLTNKDPNVGLVMYEMEDAAEKLRKIFYRKPIESNKEILDYAKMAKETFKPNENDCDIKGKGRC